MKGLKKIALATAVAAAPFATQAMEPMNDTQMGDVTGQAGVTIELSTQMTIDQIEYSQGGAGSFLIGGGDEGISIGGFALEDGTGVGGVDSNLNLSIDIDLEDNGDAVISLGSLGTLPTGGPAPVAFRAGVDEMGLTGTDGSATLISNMNVDVLLKKLDITAQVEDLSGEAGGSGSLLIETEFAVDNLDVDFDVAAVSLEGFRMGGAGQMAALKGGARYTGQVFGQDAQGDPAPAIMTMSIGAGDSLSGQRDDVLRIELDSFQADMWMPTINVGGESVGSVAISNLQVTDTTMAIYGRN